VRWVFAALGLTLKPIFTHRRDGLIWALDHALVSAVDWDLSSGCCTKRLGAEIGNDSSHVETRNFETQ